jgi:proton glutamate symport protein
MKKLTITHWIFIALVAGILVGKFAPAVAIEMDVFSKMFLKLIKTIVAPLLFSTLVIGIAGHADMKQVGRMGWKSLLYFELVTTVALAFGLIAANIVRPGDGIDMSSIQATEKIAVTQQGWKEIVLHTFP